MHFINRSITRRAISRQDGLSQREICRRVICPFWPRTPVDAPVLQTGLIISNACVAAGLIHSNQFFNILSPPLVTGNELVPTQLGTADQYTSADTTHPTSKGASAIAHWLAAKMATIWPELF